MAELADSLTHKQTNRTTAAPVKLLNGQDFLTKQLESLLKDPTRDPRRALRHAAHAPQTPGGNSNTSSLSQNYLEEKLGLTSRLPATPGVVGPMAGDGLSMLHVEQAFAAMEKSGAASRELDAPRTPADMGRRSGSSTSTRHDALSTPKANGTEVSASTASNEVLNNFVS